VAVYVSKLIHEVRPCWQGLARLFDRHDWVHANLAVIYGKLGRRTEGQTAIGRLQTLYPDFSKKARQEYRIWFLSDRDTAPLLDGLRTAGLEIPPG
jgi:hypothetical protein